MKHHFCSPESRLITISFGLAIFLCGCSSSYSVSSTGKPDAEYSYREMNQEMKGRHVTIVLKDWQYISAEEVTVSTDSVSWLDVDNTGTSQAATRQIEKIYFKNHVVGALEGLIIAPVLFAGTWALSGFSDKGIGGSDGWALPAAIGAMGGGVGLIIGVIGGHSYNYEFPTTEQKDSLQNRK